MKKIISLILVLAMVMSLSVTAFATQGIGNGGMDSANVIGSYKGNATAAIYSVDISWSGMEFTYKGAFEGIWNPGTHQYEDAVEAGWAEGNGIIKVTNHSNTGITAVPAYEAAAGYESAFVTFSTDALAVATADNGVDGADGVAVEGTIMVYPDGTLPEGTDNAVIGTITLTIS